MEPEVNRSLVEWFKALYFSFSNTDLNVENLPDGVALAQALREIAPETFTEQWLSKIKLDVGYNWRLKASNLRKVIEGIYDFYTDVLNMNLSDFPRPDAVKKGDAVDIGRLLQLVLGCAVNCNEKQKYITQIMELEESVQRNIMRALQDLESAWHGASPSRSSLSISNFDLKSIQEERDGLAQKCFELEKQVALLLEEKSVTQQEISKMQNEIQKEKSAITIGDDFSSIGPIQPGSARYNDMRRQLEALKEELILAETSKEDLKVKLAQQEKESFALHMKNEELLQQKNELSQVKDELDILREASEKLKTCETQLAVYKKKLEDYNDLKKQIKMLEDRNAEYLRQNSEFEEEAKKYSPLKGQVDLYKKEIQELNLQLDNEMSKNVKLEFEKKNVDGRITVLQREKDNLLLERDALKENIDELRCANISEDSGNNVSKELLSPTLKDKIERLETENKALREGQGGQTALAQLLDDANKRNEHFRDQLKIANERVLSLTQVAQSDDPNIKRDELAYQLKEVIELNEQKALQIDEAHCQINILQGKVSQMENSLANRDHEFASLDSRYRKCVEKAKEVIKTLDPRIANDANLLEKSSENDTEIQFNIGSHEEKLIATTFYKLGLTCQRDAVDSKFALLMGQGQSFLCRQRQSTPRKSVIQTRKP